MHARTLTIFTSISKTDCILAQIHSIPTATALGYIETCLEYAPISSSAPCFGAYVSILLSEVERKQRPSGNGDREATVFAAGLSHIEGEH